MAERNLSCWLVTDGKPGMENQCLGLAEAMGLVPTIKRIRLRFPWEQLSPSLLRIGNAWSLTADSDPIAPPWPDVLIGTGRRSVSSSLAVRAAAPSCFRIQIQDAGIRPSLFDMVVVPRHDSLRGDNVMVTTGALHRVTPAVIAAAAARLGPSFAALSRPLVAVLVGGDNGAYRMDAAAATLLGRQLAALAERGAGLLVTPSRRTGAANEAILREALAGQSAFVWDGSGENPYFALLGLADSIVATPDSVSMVSEACSTGKPVYIAELAGGSRKFDAFHQGLRDDGITRRFEGRLEPWTYQPLDDTAQVAAEAWRRLKGRVRFQRCGGLG